MRKLSAHLRFFVVPLVGLCATLGACSEHANYPVRAGMGPDPTLPPPKHSLIPTTHIAPAIGWPSGVNPTPAPGLRVVALASGLEHPRWLFELPNGDVLVAESNAPERSDEGKGVKAWFKGRAMKKAGAAVASPNRITLLRDADGDGVAEFRSTFLSGLNSPFGMALIGDAFYVANTDAVLRFPYHEGNSRLDTPGVKITDLPGGTLNHHWTKNIIASRDGLRLYATVGSNSNVGENGIDREQGRAAIVEIDLASGNQRSYATGLRNPNGLAWQSETGQLWTVVNERDELGSDLVPDYMSSVRDGGFYGWPYSYYGSHVDTRVQPPRPDLVATAIAPDYALGAHTASLGLAFDGGALLPSHYAHGAFIGQHGSWNRNPASGYKVIFVPFVQGRPAGDAEDVLSGFLDDQGNARGRPVGVIVTRGGALLVADDVGNTIWRVTRAQ
ncbi:MAG: sorbosone dehydrogenase family protein [Tahibacter sp.]